jgi:site-specific DNA-adenine methylase
MKYPGGKNAAGTYQRIINQIPPHKVYIEPFAGSAAILRFKRPAEQSIVLDRDPDAIDALRDRIPPQTELVDADALEFLARYPFSGAEFVYCDPPYLPEICRSRLRYRYKLTRDDHVRLLTILKTIRCPVMISGYWSELYAETLSGWRTDHFPQMTRGGYAIDEWLWMNYPKPVELHDYRYLGGDYREREKFSRRRKRWTAKLEKMAPIERQALLAALQEVR